MTMCSYKRIAVTDLKLADCPLPEQIKRMAEYHKPDILILRAKELSQEEYEELSLEVLEVCQEEKIECILHTFFNVAEKLNVKKIHLPLTVLKENTGRMDFFEKIGVSVHSKEQAKEAYALGAGYVIAGHVFETDCKAGVPGRGISFLKEVCESVPIPVYAIGGINDKNTVQIQRTGAAGECRMSYYMKRHS